MSILITGLELPKNKEIFLRIDEKGEVYVYGSYPTELHKAVPVPLHGDLIEREKLREKEFVNDGDAYAVVMSRDIRNAPTIIPADLEEEEMK